MLSICFALNTMHLRTSARPVKGQRPRTDGIGLERWYIGISLLVAFIVPVAPAALGHFGYDPVYESWYVLHNYLSPRDCRLTRSYFTSRTFMHLWYQSHG